MRLFALFPIALLAACSGGEPDPRGVDRDETLLSVSATGRNEVRPDMATFSAGIETFGATGAAASQANEAKMQAIVDALGKQGVDEKDIQTQSISIQRIDWGPKKGQYQAANQVSVRVRDVDKVSQAIGAVTTAKANILSGPTLTQSDPEKAKLSAYGNAYKAARARAEAYASAAGMKISRVLTIRDGGALGGPQPYYGDAMAEQGTIAAPPPMARTSSPPVSIGTDIIQVTVAVDFALEPK
ncbi:MAG: SIMPL domain-containing protein [Sphingorhabdus sp.]